MTTPQRQSPSGSSRWLFTLPSQVPRVIFKDHPLPRGPRAHAGRGSLDPALQSALAAAALAESCDRAAALLTPASGAGCWRLSEAPGLPARLLQRLGPGPLPEQVLQQPLSAPHQPGGRGSSYSRTAPLHTSLMAPLGAVWENDFSRCQKQISYISSVHIDRAEVKCLLFLVDGKRN